MSARRETTEPATSAARPAMGAGRALGVGGVLGVRGGRGFVGVVGRLSVVLGAVLVGCGVFVSVAFAGFGVSVFDGAVLNRDGGASVQAGGHPFAVTTVFELNQKLDLGGNVVPDGGAVKTVQVDLPPGLIGNPLATDRCPIGVFLLAGAEGLGPTCPAGTQVGTTRVKTVIGSQTGTNGDLPVFSLEPSPGAAATFGFTFGSVPIFIDAYVRSAGGYHVSAVVRDAAQVLIILGSSFTLWGVPSDVSHDPERQCAGGFGGEACPVERSGATFFTNPTSCPAPGEGVITRLGVDSWAAPGVFARASFVSHRPPGATLSLSSTGPSLPPDQWGEVQGMTGCEELPFAPSMRVIPDSTLPDSPTGLTVNLSFPQDGLSNPDGLATAHLKDARVTLPEGMTVSPSSADGLEGCSDAQIGIGSDSPVSCPDASKIGTVTATTPVLDESLSGSVFVGTQNSDDPASGEMFRIFLVVKNDERGVLVKLPGKVSVKPDGQIETVFENNPQVPVSTVSVHLDGGPRAPLATPPDCGPKTARAELNSWGGQVAHLEDTFTIDCPPGLGGFAPSFVAGTVNPTGGSFSPFGVRIARPDGQQFLEGLTVGTPRGLAAKLAGVALCPEGQAAAGDCPAASRIGTATVAAGPGPDPFFLSGPVSLTGPYGGGPYGLSVAIRAAAGPFDLGMVVVRQAIFVDPVDAHLTVRSDRLPVVVKGVPVRLRRASVDIDRPGFTLNPTSCAPKQIAATLTSTLGTNATRTARFQATDCVALPFGPKLTMRLTGKHQTNDGKHPGLKAVLTQPSHQAGIGGVTVRLPLSLALDPANAASGSLCEFREGQKPDPHCPRSSIVGHARATTPLLNRPLTGNVYFVKNVRIDKKTGREIRTLPTLLLALRGEVALNVRATTSISRNKLVSTFQTVPDAPVSRFELTLDGGAKGILVVTTGKNLCRSKQQATTTLKAQNGKHTTPKVTITTPCPHH